MTVLNSLKLVAAVKPIALNPVLIRRNKLLDKLDEQQQLAKAQQEGTEYKPKRTRRLKDAATGEVREVEATKKVKAWWWSIDGKTVLAVRYGNKVLELAKGRSAVEVGNSKDLAAVLAALRRAVEAGELDAQMEAASISARKGFKSAK